MEPTSFVEEAESLRQALNSASEPLDVSLRRAIDLMAMLMIGLDRLLTEIKAQREQHETPSAPKAKITR